MERKTKKWLSMVVTLSMVVGLFSHIVTTSAETEASSIPTDHLIAGGQRHSMAIKEDGTVWTWGNNEYSQLGDGTTVNKKVPQQITVQEGKKAVYAAAKQNCSMVILEDGTLWGWGSNNDHQLATPMGGLYSTPRQIIIDDGTKKVVSVAVGGGHAAALLEDGIPWTWGTGCLGDGTSNNNPSPQKITVGSDQKLGSIVSGASHFLSVSESGMLWAWGDNGWYAVGIEDDSDILSPVSIMQLFTPSAPTTEPTIEPSAPPTMVPTAPPTAVPTITPTTPPTTIPTAPPIILPTAAPTTEPTVAPTAEPTVAPTTEPTIIPTTAPTAAPAEAPYQIANITANQQQVQVDINRLEQRDQDDTVLIALYGNNGDLVGVKADLYPSANTDAQSFVFDGIDSQFSLVKVFVWDGLNSIAPLCEAANKITA